MASAHWNANNVFVGNEANFFVRNHISGDGLFLYFQQIITFLIYLGFLKNVIRAAIHEWSNDFNHYLDGDPNSPYGYGYNGGYGRGFDGYNGSRF